MSEIVDVHARYVRDLTTPNNLPADPNVLDRVKLPAGNFPVPYVTYEAITLGQIKSLILLDLDFKLNKKANTADVYDKTETYSKKENDQLLLAKADKTTTDALEVTKANKDYVDAALLNINVGASAFYPTMAQAVANISNIRPNTTEDTIYDLITIGEVEYGGTWYKRLNTDTFLTKSPYDSYENGKKYTNDQLEKFVNLRTNVLKYSLCLLDKNGIPATGLLIDLNGKPAEPMLNDILEGLEAKIGLLVSEKLLENGIKVTQSSKTGSFFIVDSLDKLSWIGIDSKGKPPAYTIQCILEGLQSSGYTIVPNQVKSGYQETVFKAVSGPDIDCVGDSMTAGAGGNGTSYGSVLKTLIANHGSTANVRNSGVGGESSPTITARMGGYPFKVKVTDGIIPAEITPIVITLQDINGSLIRPLLQGNGGASGFTGELNGVLGNIALVKPNGGSTWDASNYYTFTRTTTGTSVTTNRPQDFYTNYALERRGDIKIIWIGQNGPSTARAISDAKAIIQSMTPLKKRFLIISKPTSTDAEDSEFFNEFGEYFVPIRKYLVEYGLEDAGITPTSEDITDMAAGRVPVSLCASPTDKIHWNATGYTIMANVLFKKLVKLGWL